jgi:hypothetical protein
LLLGELRQIAIAGHAQDFKALFFNGLSQGADAQSRGVLGTIVLVDDDDGKAKLHEQPPYQSGLKNETAAKCKEYPYCGFETGCF